MTDMTPVDQLAEALAAMERAEAERDEFKQLYEAGTKQWNPVYEIVLNERDTLKAEVSRLTSALADAREALKECADELAAWVEDHYHLMLNYPSEKRRFERGMRPVRRARALLSLPTTEPKRTIRVVSPDGISWVVDEDPTTEPAKAEEDAK